MTLRGIVLFVLMMTLLGSSSAQEAIQLDQLKEAPGPNYFPLTEDGTIWPIEGIQVYQKFKDHHFIDTLFFKAPDSLCVSFNGDSIAPVCGYVGDMGCFTVLYGGGDSTVVVCPGDTMNITYPEPSMGGASDTLYYFWYQTDGGTRDTVTIGEGINYVAGTNVTITQGATNLQWDVPNMRDTCIHTLEKLNDTTAILYDCNGVNRGTASFTFNECMEYSLTVSNGVGSDTIFYNKCTGKDTVVFYPPDLNDSYIDSTRYEYGDSVTIWLLRVDTSGVIDSIPLYIAVDSIDTDSQSLTYTQNGQYDTIGITRGNQIYLFDQDSQSLALAANILSITRGNSVDLTPYLDNDTIYQSFSIDTTTALLTLSDDPTASPDLLQLPWKDAIRDNYAANYTDSIRHQGYVGINRIPLFALDVQSSDVFNEAIARFRKGSSGTATIRLERADTLTYDLMNWGSSFDIRRSYPFSGGSTEQMLRLDTTTTGRIQHYIWHDDEGYLWATDYGQGYHVPDEPDEWSYFLAPKADGKFLEIPFNIVVDSLAPNITLNDITHVIDSIELDSFRNLRERRSPYHIAFFREDSLISDYTSWDTLVLKNGAANRWIFMNDSLNSVAIGENARADNYYNSSLGAMAFQFLADTITESVNNSQVDTALNVIGGLASFITHLTDLGYTVGQAITFDVVQTGFEMPFIDTSANTHAATGLQTFIIYSGTQLKPYPAHPYDSTGVGSFDLTASQYITFSTSIGAMSQPDKNRQVALGDTLLQELRIGDSIRIKADTFYVHDQLMIWDSSFGQFIPATLQGIMGNDFAHGSVIWWDTTGQVERFQEDSINFYWSKDSMRLGIGTRDPVSRVHIKQSDNFHPDLLTIENDLGHSNIRIKPQSERNWIISARDEGLLYIASPTGPQISLHHASTEGFQIDSSNIFSFGGYGNGSKASHIDFPDSGTGTGPVEHILGINSNDGIKTLSFDSLGAQLGIALSIPTLDSFYVDPNDSLIFSFQGEDLYYSVKLPIPSGPVGDSLGTAWGDGQLVLSDGTKKGKVVTGLEYYTPFGELRIPGSFRLGDGLTNGYGYMTPQNVNLGYGRTGSDKAEFLFYTNPGTDPEAKLTRESGLAATFRMENISGGNIELKTGAEVNISMIGGQVTFPHYIGTTFDASPLKILGVGAIGNIVKTSDLTSFVTFPTDINIYATNGTLSANRKVTTADKTLTFESGTAGSFPMIKLNSTLAGGLPYFQVANGTNAFEFGIKSGNNLNISNGTNNTIVMQPGAGSNRLYFATGGNIGIGTTTPFAQLEILTAAGSGDVPMIQLTKTGGYGFSVIGQYYGHAVPTERGMYIQAQTSGQRWLVQEEIGRNVGFYNLNPGYTVDIGKDAGGAGSLRAVGDVVLGTTEAFRGPILSTIFAEGRLYIKGGVQDFNGSGGGANQFLQWHDSDLGDGSGTDNEVVWSTVDWTELSGIPGGFSDGVDNVDDADNSPTNELQSFSGASTGATNHQLILSQSGGTQTFTAGTGISFSNPGTSNVTINATGGGGSEWTDAGGYIYPSEPSDLVVVGSSSGTVATENFNIASTQATQAFWGSTTSTSSNSAGIYFNNTNMTNSLQRAGDIQAIKTTNTTGAVSIGYYDVENRRQAFYAGTAGTAIRGDATNGVFLGDHTNTNDDLQITTASNYVQMGHEAEDAFSFLRMYDNSVNRDVQLRSNNILYLQGGGTSGSIQVTGSSITMNTTGSTTVQDDMTIGADAGSPFLVESNPTYSAIGSVSGSPPAAMMRFYNSSTNNARIEIQNIVNANSDIRLLASSNVEIQSPLAIGSLFPTSTPAHMLHVTGTAFLSTGTLWTTSDRRIKTDIKTIVDPYEKILGLRPVTYHYTQEWNKHIKSDDRLKVGYIAQEYANVFPQDVAKDGDKWEGETLLNLAPEAVGPYTVAAVQQLIKDKTTLGQTISMQKTMIDTLIGEVQKLSNRITKLENE